MDVPLHVFHLLQYYCTILRKFERQIPLLTESGVHSVQLMDVALLPMDVNCVLLGFSIHKRTAFGSHRSLNVHMSSIDAVVQSFYSNRGCPMETQVQTIPAFAVPMQLYRHCPAFIEIRWTLVSIGCSYSQYLSILLCFTPFLFNLGSFFASFFVLLRTSFLL